VASKGTAIRTTQIAPGRFRFTLALSGALGGRPAGKERPVPLEKQLDTERYCACGRRLNANNQSGHCRTCAPHGRHRSRSSLMCFNPLGHRWRPIRNTKGHWARMCVHCEKERPFTDAEIAHQRRAG
jgi:hypothetical protein